jgi:D-lyxose ketol-isomerase
MRELSCLKSRLRGFPGGPIDMHRVWAEVGERPVGPSSSVEQDGHAPFYTEPLRANLAKTALP